MQSALGFGRAKSPGALTILRAEIDFSEEQARGAGWITRHPHTPCALPRAPPAAVPT